MLDKVGDDMMQTERHIQMHILFIIIVVERAGTCARATCPSDDVCASSLA